MFRHFKAYAFGLIAIVLLSLPTPVRAAEFQCTKSATVTVTAAATTQIVALAANRSVRVCAFVITESLAGSAKFVYGTGTDCVTGKTDLTAAMVLPTNGSIALSASNGSLFRTIASNALCLTAATGNITGFVNYDIF
jgi:hypothetical protein